MKFKILIVDDEVAIRDMIVSILNMYFEYEYPFLKLDVSVTSDGEEALAVVKKSNFNLILTDIVMPKMDGIALIKHIRLFDKSLPILVFSAVSSMKNINEIMEAGATNYTSKPIHKKIFLAQIKVFVDFFIHRRHRYNYNAVNLFTKKIYKRKIEFYIEQENDLLEFWEYFIGYKLDKHSKKSTLQYIYDLVMLMIKQEVSNVIFVEEDTECYYLTLSQLDTVDSSSLSNKHQLCTSDYKFDGYFESFIVRKKFDTKKQININKKVSIDFDSNYLELLDNILEFKQNDEKISAKDFVMGLDLSRSEKIENFFDDLNMFSLKIYSLENTIVNTELIRDIKNIIDYLKRFNNIVELIEVFPVIVESLNILIKFLEETYSKIIFDMEKKILFCSMLRLFMYDLEQWIENIFIDKTAKNIHYGNYYFATNCIQIISIYDEKD